MLRTFEERGLDKLLEVVLRQRTVLDVLGRDLVCLLYKVTHYILMCLGET